LYTAKLFLLTVTTVLPDEEIHVVSSGSVFSRRKVMYFWLLKSMLAVGSCLVGGYSASCWSDHGARDRVDRGDVGGAVDGLDVHESLLDATQLD
jgi:hypothetical protein